MSEAIKLNPLARGAKFELRMFVSPSSQFGAGRATQPERKALSSPRTLGRHYLNKEVSQGSISMILQLNVMSRLLFKQVIEYNNAIDGRKSILDHVHNEDQSKWFYYRSQADEEAENWTNKI
jgi:hypothetical protein